jgi:hypothetical protein
MRRHHRQRRAPHATRRRLRPRVHAHLGPLRFQLRDSGCRWPWPSETYLT